MKYRKKPVVIEAITFDELIAHGKASGASLSGGMPWSFRYKDQPITHENDECYLIPAPGGSSRMTPSDMLITDEGGALRVCPLDIFQALYEPA